MAVRILLYKSLSLPKSVCNLGHLKHYHNTVAEAKEAVDKSLLDSLKQRFLVLTKMNPPPKTNPPEPFSVIKGSLDNNGPALMRTFNDEEIKISVMPLLNLSPNAGGNSYGPGSFNQLFMIAVITKGNKGSVLRFLCDLYPDAMGIQSVSVRDKNKISENGIISPEGYEGSNFHDLDENLKDAFREYLVERGITEGLFKFLQTWLYVKEHRQRMKWLKTAGTFISK